MQKHTVSEPIFFRQFEDRLLWQNSEKKIVQVLLYIKELNRLILPTFCAEKDRKNPAIEFSFNFQHWIL